MESIHLNQGNLKKIAESLRCPTYDRTVLKMGIVHIGVGGFHRSHQAYYIHRLLEDHNTSEWGICGIGLREADRKIYNTLKEQNCLYTLIEQYPNGSEKIEVIGSIKEFLLAVDTPNLVIDKLADPQTKIVSLTITEGGYNFSPTSGDFNFDKADIQHDLEHRDKPKTVFGFLTAALRKRLKDGTPPFTILSCDNIQHNGDVARKMLLSFARQQDAELAMWIGVNVNFPNTMVDRITPVTSPEAVLFLEAEHNLKDQWPVVCEPFIQWVVEDKFSNGRPSLEKLGVQFVSDVGPYEKMKIRLLNAGHSVLGIPGAIHGHLTINACMEDPVFSNFMRQFMDKEVSPILEVIEGFDLEEYKDSLEERFANPNIKDSVSRICSESSAKLPKFLIPTLRENLDSGGSIKYATLILAAWCFYSDRQLSDKGESLEIIDAMGDELHNFATKTKDDALAFIRQASLFGDLAQNQDFVEQYVEAVQSLYKEQDIRKIMTALSLEGTD